MRIVHTADWHLGHVLYERDRVAEHRAFLTWLLELLERERADALLVCGDVFEGSNPPASAQALWYEFLAQASRRCPGLQIVVVAGNHDSPGRLEAPAPILEALRIHVVGILPRHKEGLELERLVVPLRERGKVDGNAAAWVAAVPFLRLSDLPSGDGAPGGIVAGVRDLYSRAIDCVRTRRAGEEPIVVTGHCYVEGVAASEASERKILGGNQHPLPVDIFPDDIAYVALGHLHLAQEVGGRNAVRYSGSPLPLSLDEDHYPHQVCVVDLKAGRPSRVRVVPVPRVVGIIRIPEEPQSLGSVLDLLKALPSARPLAPGADDFRPFLEVRLLRDGTEAGYRTAITDAVEGKDACLVKITISAVGTDRPSTERNEASLADLQPESVFLSLWERKFADPPPPTLLAAFHELVDLAGQEEEL
jgi:exonuclease SbcD